MGRRKPSDEVLQGIRPMGYGGGRQSRLIFAHKAQTIIPVDGPAEATVARLLDLDPQVTRFRGQPFTVFLESGELVDDPARAQELKSRTRRTNGGPQSYTPDFHVELFDRRSLALEVKDERYPGTSSDLVRLERARAVLKSRGVELIHLVLPEPHRGCIHRNASLLWSVYRCPGNPLPADTLERVEVLAHSLPILTLSDVQRALQLQSHLLPWLFTQGALGADLFRQALSMRLVVTPAHGDLNHLCMLNFDEH